MEVVLHRQGDEARFVLEGIDPTLAPAAEVLAFTACPEGVERRFPWGEGVDTVFARFTTTIEPMLRQCAGLEPVPWAAALGELARRFADGVPWCLLGSAALAARGVAVSPRDVDVVVDEAHVDEALRRLADVLVEPPVVSADWIARHFARASVGARVEVVAGAEAWLDEPTPCDFGPYAWTHRERIVWGGHEIAVPPLALQLDAARRRGLDARVRCIEAFLNDPPSDVGRARPEARRR
jgi:hypothetical protein